MPTLSANSEMETFEFVETNSTIFKRFSPNFSPNFAPNFAGPKRYDKLLDRSFGSATNWMPRLGAD